MEKLQHNVLEVIFIKDGKPHVHRKVKGKYILVEVELVPVIIKSE